MKRTLPIIALFLVVAGVVVIDPARRMGEMIEPRNLAPAELPEEVGQWLRVEGDDELPRAYPPHNAVWTRTTRYQPQGFEGLQTAFVRVVIASDRRDLLAFEPEHAMRAGGWATQGARAAHGLRVTTHARRGELLDETLQVETAYVSPGAWGQRRDIVNGVRPEGPGWPGPGALVQLLRTSPVVEDADGLRAMVKDLAGELSSQLERGATP